MVGAKRAGLRPVKYDFDVEKRFGAPIGRPGRLFHFYGYRIRFDAIADAIGQLQRPVKTDLGLKDVGNDALVLRGILRGLKREQPLAQLLEALVAIRQVFRFFDEDDLAAGQLVRPAVGINERRRQDYVGPARFSILEPEAGLLLVGIALGIDPGRLFRFEAPDWGKKRDWAAGRGIGRPGRLE